MLGFSKEDVIYLMNELEIPKEKQKELVSLLFYLGYLTIKEIGFSKCKFQIPNDVIKKVII